MDDDIPDLDDSYSIGQQVRMKSSGKIGTILGHPNDYEIKLEDETIMSKSHYFEKILDPNNDEDQKIVKQFTVEKNIIIKQIICLQSLCYQLNELTKSSDKHNVSYIKTLHNLYIEFDILYEFDKSWSKHSQLELSEKGSFFYDFLQEYLKYKSIQVIKQLKGGVNSTKLFGILALLLTITPNLGIKIASHKSVKDITEHFYPENPSIKIKIQQFLINIMGFPPEYASYLISFFTTPYSYFKINKQGFCVWNSMSFMASSSMQKKMIDQLRIQYEGLQHRINRRKRQDFGTPYMMGAHLFLPEKYVFLTHENFYYILQYLVVSAQQFLHRRFNDNECIVISVSNRVHSFNMIVNTSNVKEGCIVDANGLFTNYRGISCTNYFDTGSTMDIPRFSNLREAFNNHTPFYISMTNNYIIIENPDNTYFDIIDEEQVFDSIQQSYEGATSLLNEFYYNSSATIATESEVMLSRGGRKRTKTYKRVNKSKKIK